MPQQNKRLPLARKFVIGKKRPVIHRQRVVERGLLRLNTVGSSLMHKELTHLNRQLNNERTQPGEVLERVEKIRSLESKRSKLMRHYLKRGAHLTTLDKDFPVVMNRKSFLTKLEHIMGKSTTRGAHSLVFFDIDSLKSINTRYGRIKGGHAFLITFSRALATTAKLSRGFAGHVYGDEFLAYLPLPPAKVQQVLQTVFEQRRQKEIRKWPLFRSAKAHGVAFNYSAGIVGLRQGDSIAEAMVTADRLCDAAKIQGREKNTFAIIPELS